MKTKTMVSSGEILKGMFLTVYEWKQKSLPNILPNTPVDGTNPMMAIISTINAINNTTPNKMGCGEVFKVMAVNLPYVAVHYLNSKQKFFIDLREVNMMEVDKEYVEALGFVFDYTPLANVD